MINAMIGQLNFSKNYFKRESRTFVNISSEYDNLFDELADVIKPQHFNKKETENNEVGNFTK